MGHEPRNFRLARARCTCAGDRSLRGNTNWPGPVRYDAFLSRNGAVTRAHARYHPFARPRRRTRRNRRPTSFAVPLSTGSRRTGDRINRSAVHGSAITLFLDKRPIAAIKSLVDRQSNAREQLNRGNRRCLYFILHMGPGISGLYGNGRCRGRSIID